MDTPQKLDQLHARKALLLKQIEYLQSFRPGSLVARFRKCRKPYCHCAHAGSPGQGPSWSLTRAVGGKTVTKIIPLAAVDQTKNYLSEYKRFQENVADLIETNICICDTLLELQHGTSTATDIPTVAEKRGSKKHSPRQPQRSFKN